MPPYIELAELLGGDAHGSACEVLRQLAAEAGADAIVSGDRHLLALDAWRGIKIQTPAAYVAERGA
jgi:hypothetical protein